MTARPGFSTVTVPLRDLRAGDITPSGDTLDGEVRKHLDFEVWACLLDATITVERPLPAATYEEVRAAAQAVLDAIDCDERASTYSPIGRLREVLARAEVPDAE